LILFSFHEASTAIYTDYIARATIFISVMTSVHIAWTRMSLGGKYGEKCRGGAVVGRPSTVSSIERAGGDRHGK
jgi:hypothetical protein